MSAEAGRAGPFGAGRDILDQAAEALLTRLEANGLTVVVAELCTGGLLGQILSDAPGSSQLFHGGFLTYTKEHKVRALGVPADVLRKHGAVCAEVARAMAEGALRHSSAQLSAAITGVAGPEPDEDGNPVGRVCIAVARRGGDTRAFERHYPRLGRDGIRQCAVADTLDALIATADERAYDAS